MTVALNRLRLISILLHISYQGLSKVIAKPFGFAQDGPVILSTSASSVQAPSKNLSYGRETLRFAQGDTENAIPSSPGLAFQQLTKQGFPLVQNRFMGELGAHTLVCSFDYGGFSL